VTVRNLDYLFRPRAITLVIDDLATPVAQVLARNLFGGTFAGPILPVHPQGSAIRGVMAYRSVADLPVSADLAVVASRLDGVPALIGQLAERGTRAAVVVTADPSGNTSAETTRLHQAILDAARPSCLRVIGPACLGVIAPHASVNASYAGTPVQAGDLALLTRSGTLATTLLDSAAGRGVGFSLAISLGDMIDVDFGDLLNYLATDRHTRAILLCVDAIGPARKFLSAARAASRLKPVIVFPAGRFDPGAGESEQVAQGLCRAEIDAAAFRRAGMLPVSTLADLIAAARTVGSGMKVAGKRLAVLANGRGIAGVAADSVHQEGGSLAVLGPQTMEAINRVLPPTWGGRNPVNIFDDADAQRYQSVVAALQEDDDNDAIVVINAPTAIGATLDAARTVAVQARAGRKPLVAAWLEKRTAAEAQAIFAAHRVPSHDSPRMAIAAVLQLAEYHANQVMLTETPASVPEQFTRDLARARRLLGQAVDRGQQWLDADAARALLSCYGLETVPARAADCGERAIEAAHAIGFPVILAVAQPIRGAVAVDLDRAGDLDTDDAVMGAAHRLHRLFEETQPEMLFPGFVVEACWPPGDVLRLRLGIVVDARFGPVIFLGHGDGGRDAPADQVVGLPPLNLALARQLIGRTRLRARLEDFGAVDAVALALVKLAQLAGELAEVQLVDIDPVYVSREGLKAGSLRIGIARATSSPEARLAIQPYPSNLEEVVLTKSGKKLLMRPIRPEDEPALLAFVRAMTPHDRRLRFFAQIDELDHRMAARLTQIDYDREMKFVLVDPAASETTIWGVMGISSDADYRRGEYAGAVRSDLKGLGLGRLLMEEIIAYARKQGIREIWGEVLAENLAMLGLVRKLGFEVQRDPDDLAVMFVSLKL
jgi:acetyltransferase